MAGKTRKTMFKGFFRGPRNVKTAKLERKAKKFWHGEDADYSAYNLVGYVTVKMGRKRVPMMEKRFFREYANPEENFRLLKMFKEAGAKVIPTFRLVSTKNEKGKLEKSLLMTDLTGRGKYQVYPSNLYYQNREVGKRIIGLKNYPELRQQMHRDVLAMISRGYATNGDVWMFQVDPKTNTGKVYLTDVDAFFPSYPFHKFRDASELMRAGVPRAGIRQAVAQVESIKRRSLRPHEAAASALANKANSRFRELIKEAARKAVQADPEQLAALTGVYAGMVGLATQNQIGGAMGRSVLSLTKEQRRKLYNTLTGKERSEFSRRGRNFLVSLLFPEVEPAFVHTIRRKARQHQWDTARIGQYTAHSIATEGEKLGRPLFSYDEKEALKFEGLKKKLAEAHTREAAARLLEEHQQTLKHCMVKELKESFRKDLGALARLRLKKDLAPFGPKDMPPDYAEWERQRQEARKKELKEWNRGKSEERD